MLKRLLIANRGEIARRIARTARRLGVEVVAVYSDADADALHIKGADAAVRIGPALAAESYLAQERIIEAAKAHGCDAIHPGYGFLSESAIFAEAVTNAGIVFVGPRAETIATLGDKARAKALMKAAGVPIVPGSSEATDDVRLVAAQAEAVGYPVLLKPSAGGGGKGMQIVRSPAAIGEAAEQATRLATANFKDGRLIVERYVDAPRHVEVQVFGDAHGNVVHLFERECSLQRRYQKVIEEAPAPNLRTGAREALLAAAVSGAKAVNYLNAGTFEFLVGEDSAFYFLEVNTRLQVEHPVTEEITGVDLVEWQLRVAAGELLPLGQEQIACSGHAIEARVYAEDAADGFRPAPGSAHVVRWPKGIRVEAAIASGGVVSPYYDPLIAKLIAHGADRPQALNSISEALARSVVIGLTTNLGFLSEIVRDPAVRQADVHTGYLDQNLARLTGSSRSAEALACTAAIDASAGLRSAVRWPWSNALRLLDRQMLLPAAPAGVLSYWIDGRAMDVRAIDIGETRVTLMVDERTLDVTIDAASGDEFGGSVEGHGWSALDLGHVIELIVGGERYTIERYTARDPSSAVLAGAAISPMPGVVVALPVEVGDRVAAGDVVAVVEAMKMENRIASAVAGIVVAVNCALRETVAAGQLLVSIEAQS